MSMSMLIRFNVQLLAGMCVLDSRLVFSINPVRG